MNQSDQVKALLSFATSLDIDLEVFEEACKKYSEVKPSLLSSSHFEPVYIKGKQLWVLKELNEEFKDDFFGMSILLESGRFIFGNFLNGNPWEIGSRNWENVKAFMESLTLDGKKLQFAGKTLGEFRKLNLEDTVHKIAYAMRQKGYEVSWHGSAWGKEANSREAYVKNFIVGHTEDKDRTSVVDIFMMECPFE